MVGERLDQLPQLARARLLHLRQPVQQELVTLGGLLELLARLAVDGVVGAQAAHFGLDRLELQRERLCRRPQLRLRRPVRAVLRDRAARQRGVALLEPRELRSHLAQEARLLGGREVDAVGGGLDEALLRA